MRSNIVGECRDCQRPEIRLVGRGLCGRCYDVHWQAGTLDLFPKRSRPLAPVRTHKPCAICLVDQPLENFARNNRRPDGRGSYCKPCVKEKYHRPARDRNRGVPRPASAPRHCPACDQDQTTDDFYWKSDQARFAATCKRCKKKQDQAYREADPVAYRSKVLKRKYGITGEEFDQLVAQQGGGCAICSADVNPDSSSLAVDHCHATGRVRGVLCGPCNKALGLFRDDPLLLEKAVIYLRK